VSDNDAREITIEVDPFVKNWLRVVRKEHQKASARVEEDLLRYGLAHHEEAVEDVD
jgi:urease accessory protein UreE